MARGSDPIISKGPTDRSLAKDRVERLMSIIVQDFCKFGGARPHGGKYNAKVIIGLLVLLRG